MTTYDQRIQDSDGNDPAHGDDIEVKRTIMDLTSAQTIDKAWLTVKARGNLDQADNEAPLQLEITTTSTAAGQITDDGTDATEGAIKFTVGGSNYDGITGGTIYAYDIQLLLSDGVVTTVEKGSVLWEEDVTKATS